VKEGNPFENSLSFRDEQIAQQLPIPPKKLEEEMYTKTIRHQKYGSEVNAFAAMTSRTPL